MSVGGGASHSRAFYWITICTRPWVLGDVIRVTVPFSWRLMYYYYNANLIIYMFIWNLNAGCYRILLLNVFSRRFVVIAPECNDYSDLKRAQSHRITLVTLVWWFERDLRALNFVYFPHSEIYRRIKPHSVAIITAGTNNRTIIALDDENII